ncbi:MMPL family transporter, partial [Streptomyces sp. NPDC047028]|uniref:MMPL family transporter n=1 Tax=Streptomyces sp. NPDC047028 TaxID=3155793 RepID=UPI00340A5E81
GDVGRAHPRRLRSRVQQGEREQRARSLAFRHPHALEITARIITCAALIMVSVFAAFILSHNIVVKMLGLGLAVSALIDASVVRLLLVPAVMTLLGRQAWWTPLWLDRLMPRIDAEGDSEAR